MKDNFGRVEQFGLKKKLSAYSYLPPARIQYDFSMDFE